METNPLYPFERNRYYSGKLLTARDFQVEQDYINNKRRFLNQFLFGRGIVCGLSVFNLDDFSIMIESGVAIDSTGRELVVGSTVVKKLSAIKGFSELKTERATLCLRYEEELTQPVYTMEKEGSSQEFENNRFCESYELSLEDTQSLKSDYEMESEFYSSGQLYQDDTYTIEVVMPAVVSCGSLVKLVLRMKCHRDIDSDINLQAVLQTPAFTDSKGQQQVEIQTGNVRMVVGETYESEYWILAQKQENNSTSIIAKAENIRIVQGGEERIASTNFSLRTAIKSISSNALITREIGRMSLEMRQMGNSGALIQLAEFHLVRTEKSYIIERVLDGEVKHYIALPAESSLRAEYASFYSDATQGVLTQPIIGGGGQEAMATGLKTPIYARGICEIPLSAHAKSGMIFHSDEILHGLGRGDVQVEVGLQYLQEDKRMSTEGCYTFYGDVELFHEGESLPVVHAHTAIKVLNDRGTFVVAMKLAEDATVAVASLSWSAVKLPRADGLDYMDENANGSIVAELATVALAPTESHFVNIRFKNMDQCSLHYSVSEENGGIISNDGIYTAPAKEGIYEIKIACAESPMICTYAYAVVRKVGPSK